MKLGKRPAREGAVKLNLRKYVNLSRLPTPPESFGDEKLVTGPWGVLGNSDYGCCFWSGSAHETMLWTRTGGNQASFDTDGVLSDYSACTGFNRNEPNTDQGTDIQQGAAYRQKIGIIDASGNRHKIAAYASVDPGDLEMLLSAIYCFEAIGIGVRFPNSAMQQFNDGQPFSVVANDGGEDGGHYMPGLARRNGRFVLSSWGYLPTAEDDWIRKYNDENLVYFSPEMLSGTKSLEGFDAQQLSDDLASLHRQAA